MFYASGYLRVQRRLGRMAAGLMLAISGAGLSAQNLTGSINGHVTDDSGAVVHGATVAVSSSDTGLVVRALKTDRGGRYDAPSLQVGNYTIKVEMAGFKTAVVKGIKLDVDESIEKPSAYLDRRFAQLNAVSEDMQPLVGC